MPPVPQAGSGGDLMPVQGIGTGVAGPLGSTTKSHSTVDFIEVFPATKKRFVADSDDDRGPVFRRYALQRAAAELLPRSRTASCGRKAVPGTNATVMTMKSSPGKAFFGHLMLCGSVWVCPVCQAKVAERRRAELAQAVINARRQGLCVFLLTATVPHGMGDDLLDILERMLRAWSAVHEGRGSDAVRGGIGRVGYIRSLEVTYGVNGFHPHIHCLLFVDGKATAENIERIYAHRWRVAAVNHGFSTPHPVHGLTVQDGHAASSYVCKWGIESEMTRWQSKRGREGGLTPYDFLRRYMEGGADAERYAKLFGVYASAFKGRRQLVWSRGLRDLLLLDDELSDEQLVSEQREEAVVLAELSPIELKAIVAGNHQAWILKVAGEKPELLPAFLDAVVEVWLSRLDYVPPWYWQRRVPVPV